MLVPEQTRRDNARFVRNEQIARLQVIVDVAKDAILQAAILALHHEHLAAIACGVGGLCDELLRQIVIEI